MPGQDTRNDTYRCFLPDLAGLRTAAPPRPGDAVCTINLPAMQAAGWNAGRHGDLDIERCIVHHEALDAVPRHCYKPASPGKPGLWKTGM